MKQKLQKKPFAFLPSQKSQKRYKDISAEEKLNWLEEANQFVIQSYRIVKAAA